MICTRDRATIVVFPPFLSLFRKRQDLRMDAREDSMENAGGPGRQ